MSGNFFIGESKTLDELEGMTEEEKRGALVPISELFSDLQSVKLPEFYARLALSGNEIYQKKLRTSFPIGDRIAMYDQNGEFFAVGEVREYEDGAAIKPIKQFGKFGE